MKQLGRRLRLSQPRLADFLELERFVDDLNTSEPTKEAIDQLQKDADEACVSLGMESKGWAKSGEEPSEEISEDGAISVAGMGWFPLIDSLEVKYARILGLCLGGD